MAGKGERRQTIRRRDGESIQIGDTTVTVAIGRGRGRGRRVTLHVTHDNKTRVVRLKGVDTAPPASP